MIIWQLGRRFKREGLVFLSYLAFYSMGRFLLTFIRQENITLWGLQQAQIIALLAFIAAVAGTIYLARKPIVTENPT